MRSMAPVPAPKPGPRGGPIQHTGPAYRKGGKVVAKKRTKKARKPAR